jgi:hypothetical protein
MVAYNFDQMLVKGVRAGQIPARTQAARTWFRDIASKSTITPNALMREDRSRLTTRPAMGKMYAFFYDPKHKKTLPYYDRFPLIFKIENVPNGFMGINLHYLPPPLRAKLMDALYNLTTNNRYDETTKLRMSYEILNSASKYRYFKPTLKMYLNAHVKSRFLEVSSVEWDMALFLPTERFVKANKSAVWKDSRAAIRGR